MVTQTTTSLSCCPPDVALRGSVQDTEVRSSRGLLAHNATPVPFAWLTSLVSIAAMLLCCPLYISNRMMCADVVNLRNLEQVSTCAVRCSLHESNVAMLRASDARSAVHVDAEESLTRKPLPPLSSPVRAAVASLSCGR